MPVSCVLDPEQRVVHATFALPLMRREVAEFQDALRADPRFDPSFQSLCTVTGSVRDGLLSPYDLRVLLAQCPYGPSSRHAIVVTHPVVYGLLRILDAFANGAVGEFGLHRDRASALRWLGGATAPP